MKRSVIFSALLLSLTGLSTAGTVSAHERDRGNWGRDQGHGQNHGQNHGQDRDANRGQYRGNGRHDRDEWQHDRGYGYYRSAPHYYAAPRHAYHPYHEHDDYDRPHGYYYGDRDDYYGAGYVYARPAYPDDYPAFGVSLYLPLR